MRVAKLRAQPYATGYHDFKIRTGGIVLYPRLVAAEYRRRFEAETVSSGVPELDALFCGGADRGTAILLLGPSGSGKSIVASQFAVASAGRDERCAMYIFDERVQTLLQRAEGLGLDLESQADRGLVEIRQVDPAELSPGEFADDVCRAVTERGVRMVIIDSLAGYAYAMPRERLLALHLHELLSFLNQKGVTVVMSAMRWRGFLLHLLGGILYTAVGGLILIDPVAGAIGLSFLLAVFFLVSGAFKMVLGIQAESGWFAFSGLIDLLLGVLIWLGWPETATWVIGLFLGIELLFAGISLILIASRLRSASRTERSI